MSDTSKMLGKATPKQVERARQIMLEYASFFFMEIQEHLKLEKSKQNKIQLAFQGDEARQVAHDMRELKDDPSRVDIVARAFYIYWPLVQSCRMAAEVAAAQSLGAAGRLQ
jgi:hypothetical protein